MKPLNISTKTISHYFTILPINHTSKMDESTKKAAKVEINKSLMLSIFSMRHIGLSFDKPKSASAYFRQKLIFVASVCGICCHVFSEFINIVLTFASSPRVEDVVPLFHTFGYGALSKIFYRLLYSSQLLLYLSSVFFIKKRDWLGNIIFGFTTTLQSN